MNKPELIYTTYIRSTPEKVWTAITNPEFARQYWGGHTNVSDWQPGSSWTHVADDEQGTVRVVGKVEECVPPQRLVMTWVDPDDQTDVSRVTFEIEAIEDMVRLDVIHGDFTPGKDMIEKVSGGWPRVLSSLKSFLETGAGLNVKAGKSGCGQPTKPAAAA
jgi:uncharacterized protein YndB with AHSA1/START domain